MAGPQGSGGALLDVQLTDLEVSAGLVLEEVHLPAPAPEFPRLGPDSNFAPLGNQELAGGFAVEDGLHQDHGLGGPQDPGLASGHLDRQSVGQGPEGDGQAAILRLQKRLACASGRVRLGRPDGVWPTCASGPGQPGWPDRAWSACVSGRGRAGRPDGVWPEGRL